MEIRLNKYFDGQVQSLAFIEGDQTLRTVGAVLPGEYNFPDAERQEKITLTSGALIINDQQVTPRDFPFVIKKGNPIKIVANVPATYVCEYS